MVRLTKCLTCPGADQTYSLSKVPREIRPNDSISQVISAFRILAASFIKGNVRRGLQFERGLHPKSGIC